MILHQRHGCEVLINGQQTEFNEEEFLAFASHTFRAIPQNKADGAALPIPT